jgi:transaldolase
MSKLLNIKQYGQRIWIDNLSRELIKSGTIQKLIDNDGIAGITSNPTIFHKAISNDKYYQDDLIKVKQSNLTLEERYEALVIPDIIAACDLMLPVYEQSNHSDGYVSFEVSPYLANDTIGTIQNAKRLWQHINRPNLMIKVPATKDGAIAFEELIAEGINVNITLLFSLNQVLNIWQAYINGLQKRHNQGLAINNIKSVASFFLSRIDSAIDDKLPPELIGKTAINLAKTAYLAYSEIFDNIIFAPLKSAGAKGQSLLWASTGTKNPNYSDVLYVDTLIGDDTINTAPEATLDAFRDHGIASNSLYDNINDAPLIIEQIKHTIDLAELGETLQRDGLKLFTTSFDSLLELVK